MAEGIVWGALALILVTAMVRFFDRSKPAPSEPVALRELHPYHCVSIKSASNACAVARRLEGLRFLAHEAPTLPLPGCSALNCTCTYAHHDDRRHHARRNIWSPRPQHGAPDAEGELDRRATAGRRKTDGVFHPAS